VRSRPSSRPCATSQVRRAKSQDPEEPSVFRIFEIYEDQDAVTAHTQYPHFVQWAAGQAIPALEERRREFYQTLDF
jgi:quinol monooxygenase YgiN